MTTATHAASRGQRATVATPLRPVVTPTHNVWRRLAARADRLLMAIVSGLKDDAYIH